MSTVVLPERWTELSAASRQKTACLDDIHEIQKSCETDCGRFHVADCPSCFAKVVERLRTRYHDSQDREWFTERRAFKQELDGLLVEVGQRKASLDSVEARIESEKEAWYRWTLRRYPDFLAVAEDGCHQQALRDLLDNPDQGGEELVRMVWEGVGKPAEWSNRVDELVHQVSQAHENHDELKAFYIKTFFTNQSTDNVLDHAQPYLDWYKSGNISLEEVVGRIVRELQQARATQPQRENHQRRLDELRRARTAFEQNRSRTKGRHAGAQSHGAGDHLYRLPPCAVCHGAVNNEDVLLCSACQVIVQFGSEKPLAVYCSEDCYRQGHDEHVLREHECSADAECSQLIDEDVEIENRTLNTVVCLECLEEKQLTLFCSIRCSDNNLPAHCSTHHARKGTAAPPQAYDRVLTLREVVESTTTKENPGLRYTLLT